MGQCLNKAMINKENLEKAAKLSMLKLTPEQQEKTLNEMTKILEHFKELQNVDTSGVEPLHNSVLMENVWRKDEVSIKESQEELKSILKDTLEGQIKVPQVV
jgi:aspartyl-tRNA(Asn)/glutamyl-tRNA(Gln) amidotransferase subunit C